MKVHQLLEGEVIPFDSSLERKGKKIKIDPILKLASNKLVYETFKDLVQFLGTTAKLPSEAIEFEDKPGEVIILFRGKASVALFKKSPDAVKKFTDDLKSKFPKLSARLNKNRVMLKFTDKGSHFAGNYFLSDGSITISLVLKTDK